MQRIILLIVLAASAWLTTGCLRINGVHVLHAYGETDTGGYRIGMNGFTYGLLNGNGTYGDMVSRLHRFSRPVTRFDGDQVYLEDTSSTASMERMYDTYTCTPAAPGFVNCRFVFTMNAGDAPGWSVDWDVVLQPGMQVVSSNHHRTRRENGHDHLIWFFDGNRVSTANVDFTIRVSRVG